MSRQFTPAEQAVLRIVQANLPDSLTPYADIAEQAGMTEAQVLELLSSLKESGAIRRFGASIKHQKTGWAHNAMVAWKISPDMVESAAQRLPSTTTFRTYTTAPVLRPTGHTNSTP